ncbi:hypothetical protein [Stutzerimonas balearica]|uniref:hypothetical protein n=1 Tax=Stutzerimonas balearica TaxID=74829 RepID=UPI0028ADBDC5|nr:hypothetical protein [Stutzerimonas balearica]
MTEQTLQQLLAQRVSEYAASDRPRELIDAGIDKMFKEVIDDAFRAYGDFGKAIKEAVKEALPANVSDMFELTRYNALVAEALRQRWEAAAVSETLMVKANAAIDEVLKNDFASGEVSLRALLEAFVEEHKEKAAEEHWERPEIRFEDGSIGSGEFLHIYFDPEPEDGHRSERSYLSSRASSSRDNYELKHALHVRIERERKIEDRHWPRTEKLGSVYSAKLDEKKVAVDMQIYSEWERMLASLYFGNATLVIDCEPDDFSYGFD